MNEYQFFKNFALFIHLFPQITASDREETPLQGHPMKPHAHQQSFNCRATCDAVRVIDLSCGQLPHMMRTYWETFGF